MRLIDTFYKIYYGKYFRIFLAGVVFIAGFAVVNTINSQQFYDELLDLRKTEVKRITDIAYNTIKPILLEFREGHISKSEALSRVTSTVRNMTFNDNVTSNYVFMSSYSGIMLVQPYEKEREGMNMLELKDIYGKYIIKELIQTAKSKAGCGFVEYFYYPPRGPEPKLKISYVKGIPEIDAYIGVGMYVFDLETIFQNGRKNAILFDGIVLILTSVLIFLFILPFLKAYSLFAKIFAEIQSNPSLRPKIKGVKSNPRSSLDKLLKSFDDMLVATYKRQKDLQKTQDLLLEEIEQKKLTQQELSKTMAILKEELAQSPAGIVVTDSDSIRATMISKTAVEILGLNINHLPHLSISDEHTLPFQFYNLNNKRVFFKDLSLYQSTTSGKVNKNVELQVIRQDGEKRWILANTAPVYDDQNRLVAGISVFLDISDRKSYEFRIEKLNKELENRVLERTSQLEDAMLELKVSREQIINETQKLYELNQQLSKSQDDLRAVNASKDKFFNIIAHDIKSPLAGFQSMLEVMSLNYERMSADENKKFIEMLQKTSKQLFDLLENLLNWSRSQTGIIEFMPTPTDLSNIVESTVKLYRNNISNKNIDVIVDLKQIDIKADTFMINTIIRNLLSNAIKFSFENSKIEILSDLEDDCVKIAVKDYGVGITEKDISKLFRIDVNHTTIGTKKEVGTGLGLILCKEFAERHGGRILIESSPGKGSTFKVFIPIFK